MGMVEYKFSDDDGWKLGCIGKDSLQHYRKMKFKLWLEMLRNPKCAAQFRRMLQIGLITTLYDKEAFPTEEKDKDKFQVKDEKGKMVDIPHPVYAMRIWDCEQRKYVEETPRLDGAPQPDKEKSFWEGLIAEFQAAHLVDKDGKLIEE